MTVDNELISSKLEELRIKHYECRKVLTDIEEVVGLLTEIKEQFDKSDPPVKKPIIDKQLGSEMSTQRRQNIFDMCITKADSILNS